MSKNIFVLVVISLSVFSCSDRQGNYSFDKAKKATIDESKVVLTRLPAHVVQINDTIIGFNNSYQNVSLYNINTGKNLCSYSLIGLNFDSLIQVTYGKHYAGFRKYIHDKGDGGGMENSDGTIQRIVASDGKVYMFVTTLAEIIDKNDTASTTEYDDNEEIKKLKAQNTKVKMVILSYIEFLFVADTDLKLLEIIPLYDRPKLKTDDNFAFLQIGYGIIKGSAYSLLQERNFKPTTLRSKITFSPDQYSVVRMDLKDVNSVDYLLPFKDVDFSSFTYQDYFSVPYQFKVIGDKFIFSNGKDIVDVDKGEILFSHTNLQPNEWVGCYLTGKDGKDHFINYTMEPKKNPTDFEKIYAIDSMSTMKLRLFDPETKKWEDKGDLPVLSNKSFLLTDKNIIYVESDSTHYFIKQIPYNED